MKNKTTQLRKVLIKSCRGAAAIEFVFLFLIFFTLLYAIATYSLIFLLQTSFHHAASEGARSAISVNAQAYVNESAYLNQGVVPTVRSTVGTALSWLPAKARNRVLGANNSNVDITVMNKVLTVRVVYRNYVDQPWIPLLIIPGIGPIYSGPTNLEGRAVIRLV